MLLKSMYYVKPCSKNLMGEIWLLRQIGLKAQYSGTLPWKRPERSLLVKVGYSLGVGYCNVMEAELSEIEWKAVTPDMVGGLSKHIQWTQQMFELCVFGYCSVQLSAIFSLYLVFSFSRLNHL